MRSFVHLASLFLITVLVGCATPMPSAETMEWYDTRTQAWVDSVKSSCDATHDNFMSGASPVDCSYSGDRTLAMSFPNRAFFDLHAGGVGEYLQNWCASISARHGFKPTFALTMRKEGRTYGIPCTKQGEMADEEDHPR